jgi:hypothetical protein
MTSGLLRLLVRLSEPVTSLSKLQVVDCIDHHFNIIAIVNNM